MDKLSTVYLEVTNRCNKNCKHCFNGKSNNSESKELSLKEIHKTIDELKEKKVSLIKIVGGEPLLRKDLNDILLYIEKMAIHYVIFTDSKEIIKKIDFLKKLSFMDEIRVSLDGDKIIHDIVRKPGDFQEMENAAEMLHENRIPVRINYTINKQNYTCIEDVYNEFRTKGIGLSFGMIKKCETAEKNKNLLFEKEDIAAFRKWLSQIRTVNNLLFYEIINNIEDHKDFTDNYIENKELIGCYAGQCSCFIDSTGNIWPCGMIKGYNQYCYGNILESPFSSIWEKMNKEWAHITPYFSCDTCKYSSRCTGGCRANGLFYNGDIRAKDPDCKLYCNSLCDWADL